MNVAIIIAVAILIEGLVEYGKNIAEMFYGGEKKDSNYTDSDNCCWYWSRICF